MLGTHKGSLEMLHRFAARSKADSKYLLPALAESALHPAVHKLDLSYNLARNMPGQVS